MNSVAEIGRHANHDVDGDEPCYERRDLLIHSLATPLPLSPGKAVRLID
jgi:hypothetical protein